MRLPFERSPFHSSMVMPLFILFTGGVQLLILLLVFFNGSQTSKLANNPPPSLVMSPIDGRAYNAIPVPNLDRSPAVINRVVTFWLLLTHNWSDKMKTHDLGTNSLKVPEGAWEAAFLLTDEDEFRQSFLTGLARMMPEGVLRGNAQVAFKPTSISEPKPIKGKNGQVIPGEWRVDVVGWIIVSDTSSPEGRPIPYRKKFFLQAVPQSVQPLPESASHLQKVMHDLMLAGLQIYKIEDLTPEDVTP